jgi:hypothetical protein
MLSPTVRPWDLENSSARIDPGVSASSPLLLRSDFRPPDEVRLADHSDHCAGLVDHRQRADVIFDQKLDRRGDVGFRFHGHDVADHHVRCFHGVLHNVRAPRWRRLPMCDSRSSAARRECIICVQKPKNFSRSASSYFRLRSLHFATNFVLPKMRSLPFINFGYRMVDRGKGLFLFDCDDPFLDRRLVGRLHLIEFRGVVSHNI